MPRKKILRASTATERGRKRILLWLRLGLPVECAWEKGFPLRDPEYARKGWIRVTTSIEDFDVDYHERRKCRVVLNES
jgi:hypothetical protein